MYRENTHREDTQLEHIGRTMRTHRENTLQEHTERRYQLAQSTKSTCRCLSISPMNGVCVESTVWTAESSIVHFTVFRHLTAESKSNKLLHTKFRPGEVIVAHRLIRRQNLLSKRLANRSRFKIRCSAFKTKPNTPLVILIFLGCDPNFLARS